MKEFFKKYIGLFIVTILLPLILDWLIIGNHFPSNLSNNEWVTFLGSYCGGVIGGCITLFVLYKTLEDNKKSLQKTLADNKKNLLETFKENERLAVAPYLIFEHISGMPKPETPRLHLNNRCNNSGSVKRLINIVNVGKGPAIQVKIKSEDNDIVRQTLIKQNEDMVVEFIYYLQSEEKAEFNKIECVNIELEDAIGNKYIYKLKVQIVCSIENNGLDKQKYTSKLSLISWELC